MEQLKTREEVEKHMIKKFALGIHNQIREQRVHKECQYLYIDTSTIKNSGNGLFTNKSLKKDELICFYYISLLMNEDTMAVEWVDEKILPKIEDNLSYSKDYFINIANYNIYFDPSSKVSNKYYVGQYMNDKGYNPHKLYSPLKNNCRACFNSFELMTDSFKNNQSVVIKANRDINAGEELFLTYGNNYWYGTNKGISRHLKIKSNLKDNK